MYYIVLLYTEYTRVKGICVYVSVYASEISLT